ncbi:quinone-dependent dihydroorotate dehydrogenase [Oculatella sp. LEGE 06141]|uniref:quinone-dependent dihydroorotate dehydrogenase n=1 Tax=Oculatella sp. LEGE 06141 TaxID=1828648 RepID=UPI00187F38CB|nr:quinone-dependent dihydroorotate dehydrogenase [Oculatella sp. LEGE 06141]
MDIYQTAVRPVLFSGLKADPELLHQRSLQMLNWMDAQRDRPPIRWLHHQLQQAYCIQPVALQQTLWGLSFNNPVGLAAGFDKDGLAVGMWPNFGFGFAELGTVTLHAQPGNPKPRLFRLPSDQAALNRMGFNNQGAAALAERLSRRRLTAPFAGQTSQNGLVAGSIPIGINLGKSKITPLEMAAEDYVGSFRLLKALGDYFVVNVSSPNTPGLRSLQAADQLERIFIALQQENDAQKPILVKIAPDLEWDAIAAVIDLAQAHRLAGIIATNTTIRRDNLITKQIAATGNPVSEEAGGISGAPVRQRATEIIRFIYQKTGGQLPIVGVGGIFTAQDAWEKITAGASLIQVYTGWIYEGPWMVRRILEGLSHQLEQHDLATIADAVGLSA